MKLFNEFGIDIGYVVLGMAGVILLMFIMLIVTMAKNSSTRKKYKKYKFLQLRKRIRNRGIFSIFSKTLSICFYKNQTIIKEKTVQEESLWQF